MIHNLDSLMLFIHPPLSFFGYLFIFGASLLLYLEIIYKKKEKFMGICLYGAWFFNFMGLITGMIWAWIAWGSYWSWDLKENVTLVLFTMVCLAVIFYEKKKKISFIFLLLSIILIIFNIFVTLQTNSLHSYGF